MRHIETRLLSEWKIDKKLSSRENLFAVLFFNFHFFSQTIISVDEFCYTMSAKYSREKNERTRHNQVISESLTLMEANKNRLTFPTSLDSLNLQHFAKITMGKKVESGVERKEK